MFPDKLTCPRCGNTIRFRETALRYTLQPFTIHDGGSYADADWDCFEVVGEENFPVGILCDAEACRAGHIDSVIWFHPHLKEAERLLAEDAPAQAERR